MACDLEDGHPQASKYVSCIDALKTDFQAPGRWKFCFLGHPDCDIWFWLPGERTQSALQEIFLNCIFQQLSEIYIYLLSHLIFLRLLFCALNIPFTITSCTCFKDAVSFPLPLRTLTGSFHLPVFMFLQFLYLQASLSSRLEVCLGICLLIFRSKSRKREIWS